MNLIKDPNDPNRLKSDLDTIQRDFGVLQGTITAMQAQIAALQVKTTLGVPVIQPNSVVKTFHTVDPTVPTVPFGGVSPSTPQVFGPVYQVDVPNLNFIGLATTPLTLVAGVPNKVIVPLHVTMESQQTAGTFTNGNTGVSLCIDIAANVVYPFPVPFLIQNANTRFGIELGTGSWNTGAPVAANQHFTGKALKITTTANITNGGGGVATVNLSVLYWLASMTLFS